MGEMVVKVRIHPNTPTVVILPGKEATPHEIGTGTYHFTAETTHPVLPEICQ
jgi:hypothetical protein